MLVVWPLAKEIQREEPEILEQGSVRWTLQSGVIGSKVLESKQIFSLKLG